MTARSDEPFDPRVVAPWTAGSGSRAVLLIHGFAGTPPELRACGEALAERGWHCRGLVLPGHGATPADLVPYTWPEWAAAVEEAVDELHHDHAVVCLVGQSMGAALALHTAAHDLRIAAVASLATPLWLSGVLQRFLPIIQHVVPWHRPDDDVDLWDPLGVDRLWSYGQRSTHAINQLRLLLRTVRDELAAVRAPVLLLHGGRDRMIDPACADEARRRLVCSAAVEQRVLPRSGHAISVDVDHESVEQHIVAWFERHAAAASLARAV